MRLWHKDLIQVLPRKQLISQWRECCLIAKNIKEKGTPNHILVNKILDYNMIDFVLYSYMVYNEIKRRHYNCNERSFTKYISDKYTFDKVKSYEGKLNIFSLWHNERYLMQCVSNLEEKYDCGMLTKEEMEKIEHKAYMVRQLLYN